MLKLFLSQYYPNILSLILEVGSPPYPLPHPSPPTLAVKDKSGGSIKVFMLIRGSPSASALSQIVLPLLLLWIRILLIKYHQHSKNKSQKKNPKLLCRF